MSKRISLLFSAAAMFFAPDAQACSCMPSTAQSSWWNNTDSFVVDVINTRVDGPIREYLAEVVVPLNGCSQPGERIALVTPRDGATCGAYLGVGERWVVFGNSRNPVGPLRAYSINSCDFNRPASQITAEERAYLEGRQRYCADDGTFSCVDNSQPVQCFADPCTVNSCSEDATCYANYCGGCAAEFYDDSGYQVCL